MYASNVRIKRSHNKNSIDCFTLRKDAITMTASMNYTFNSLYRNRFYNKNFIASKISYSNARSEQRIVNNANRRNRQLSFQKHILVFFAITFSVVMIFIGMFSQVHAEDAVKEYKYYKNITVGVDDTLWTIAEDNISYDNYKDIDAYISEVKFINHIDDNNNIIFAGSNLVVPYYSTDLK